MPRLHLITGLRVEWLRLDRRNYNQAGSENTKTGFDKTFNPTNVRAGLVYDIVPDVTAYASYILCPTVDRDIPQADGIRERMNDDDTADGYRGTWPRRTDVAAAQA